MKGSRSSIESFKIFVGIRSQVECLLGRDKTSAAIVEDGTGENSRKQQFSGETENEGKSASAQKARARSILDEK